MKKTIYLILLNVLLVSTVFAGGKGDNRPDEIESFLSQVEDVKVSPAEVKKEEKKAILFRYKGLYGLVNENLEVVLRAEYSGFGVSPSGKYVSLSYNPGQSHLRYTKVVDAGGDTVWQSGFGESPMGKWAFADVYHLRYPFSDEKPRVVDVATGKVTMTPELIEINAGIIFETVTPSPAYAGKYRSADKKSYDSCYVTRDMEKVLFFERDYNWTGPMAWGAASVVNRDFSTDIIRSDGSIIYKDVVECSRFFCEGLMPVILSDGRSGFINVDGEFEIECPIDTSILDSDPRGRPRFDCVFSEGVAYVPVSGTEWRIYRRDGSVAASGLSNPPAGSGVFREGMLVVSEKGADGGEVYGYMDTEGRLALPCVFTEATEFRGGYAIVEHAWKEALVDKAGRLYYSDDIVTGDRTSRGSVE